VNKLNGDDIPGHEAPVNSNAHNRAPSFETSPQFMQSKAEKASVRQSLKQQEHRKMALIAKLERHIKELEEVRLVFIFIFIFSFYFSISFYISFSFYIFQFVFILFWTLLVSSHSLGQSDWKTRSDEATC
jgi:hypothetical protein